MNLKHLRLVSLISISFILIIYSSDVYSMPKVLYGSSAVALPTNIQEFVFSGFYLALRERLSESEIKEFLVQDQRPGVTPMEAFEVIQNNLKLKLDAVFGFPSTHESQLVYPVVKENNILTFFASSTNANLRDAGPKIFSTSDDPKLSTSAFINIMKTQYKGKRGVVFYFPDDYFSFNQKKVWDHALQEEKSLKLDFYAFKKNLKDPDLIKLVENYDFIIITSFPTIAFDLLNLLRKNKIDLPVFTNSSWYKVNNEILSRILSDKQKEVYMVDIWDRESQNSKLFFQKYQEAFHTMPRVEAAIGYDLGLILAELINRIKDKKMADIYDAFLINPCFYGSPLGDVCFDPKGGFGNRTLNLIKFINGKKIVFDKINK